MKAHYREGIKHQLDVAKIMLKAGEMNGVNETNELSDLLCVEVADGKYTVIIQKASGRTIVCAMVRSPA